MREEHTEAGGIPCRRGAMWAVAGVWAWVCWGPQSCSDCGLHRALMTCLVCPSQPEASAPWPYPSLPPRTHGALCLHLSSGPGPLPETDIVICSPGLCCLLTLGYLRECLCLSHHRHLAMVTNTRKIGNKCSKNK